MQLAEKMSRIGTESAFEVLARARALEKQGKHIIHLEIGEPDFPTPAHVVEAGDEVIYPDPSFPIYESLIHFLGATPVGVPVVESRGFSFDLETLRSRLSNKTKLVILNSPANPTGGVIPRDDIAQMADMLRARDVIVLSDEIYSRIWYEHEPTSITSFDGMVNKTVILDGFSKTY